MPTTPRVRVPARMLDFILGSDAGAAAERVDKANDNQYDADQLSAYRLIFATPQRADGSRHVAGLSADQLDALKDAAEYLAMGSEDNTWHADGRADLAAARATLRAIEKAHQALAEAH